MKQSSYIRFLNCLNSMEASDSQGKLDVIEERLLNQVTLSYSQGIDVLVGDLLKLDSIGSQATLHGRIKNLVAMGYLKQTIDAKDGRRKKLAPTKYAFKHYDALSKCLEKAVKSA